MELWRRQSEELAARVGFAALKEAAETLSAAYREGRATEAPRPGEDQLLAAYLTVRYPATRAACAAVARAIAERLPDFRFESILDVGAGCGASLDGFTGEFASLRVQTAIERLPAMARMGKLLQPDAQWRTADYWQMDPWPRHEVVLASYSFGEAPQHRERLIEKAWAAAEELLVLVEPGTTGGAALIAEMRTQLLAAGAHLVAPCPNGGACPEPWCHFAARINRTSLHRRVKGGELSYEDEKFSYLVASRRPIAASAPRILRHPHIQPGKIDFVLCDPPKKVPRFALKRNKAEFRFARKAEWGGLYAPPTETSLEESDS